MDFGLNASPVELLHVELFARYKSHEFFPVIGKIHKPNHYSHYYRGIVMFYTKKMEMEMEMKMKKEKVWNDESCCMAYFLPIE